MSCSTTTIVTQTALTPCSSRSMSRKHPLSESNDEDNSKPWSWSWIENDKHIKSPILKTP
ncbi:Hypothetical protein CINCED_3A016114 [Cinara cedri]|uniref:Uncharacterized protein n=1 Tax=Cinara cedri TaxID=506608 RepID=A0A5E4NEI2_9HEMI|nr:Hypothetical protein CINCED_3A016114 [Cinara cedri]